MLVRTRTLPSTLYVFNVMHTSKYTKVEKTREREIVEKSKKKEDSMVETYENIVHSLVLRTN